ncbi:MAG: PilC/PilY family type IV pilus protein [Rudaea sp.]|uniref:pilus assembly protein n=1 Tax=Rudaea sp. TaxID=2136325 RepID=UPI0039E54E9C
MNTQPTRKKFLSRWLALLGLAVSAGAGADTGPTLADAAIYSTVVVPANVAFALSVEFPTAVGDAYFSTKTYSTSVEFVGYFNPNMCYSYVTNTTHTALFEKLVGYFTPVSAASSHVCSGYWSGNFLNWILTQTIDPLRKTMTGGARIVDEAGGATILQRAYQDSQSGTSNQILKTLSGSTLVAGATPFSWSAMYIWSRNGGLNFEFSSSSLSSWSTSATTYTGSPSCTATTGTGTTTGGSNSNSTSPYFQLTSNSALTLAQGCTGTITVSAAFGTGSNQPNSTNPVNLSVSGLPTGVTASWSSTQISTSGNSVTLTLTASSSATTSGTITITGTNSRNSKTTSTTVTLSTASAITYMAQAAVQVCTSADLAGTYSELEGNSYSTTAADGSTITVTGRCRAYGSVYKPVGLMQKYAAENATQTDAVRYSAFGYMLDSAATTAATTANENLDGGVLRARMAYVGPYKASPGSSPVNNSAVAEWDASTGVFAANPDSTDATATSTVTNGGTSAKTNGVSRSGVANYLNLFGFVPTANYSATTRAAYKRYDSVSELYYMALRYFRNLGNIASHTSTAAAITNGEATNDHFPVIESWDDPIAYSCSTNYVIGIGDIHTWDDENLPTGNGSATVKSSYEVTAYAPSDDAAVSARGATDLIAKLENLAGDTGGSGRNNPYTSESCASSSTSPGCYYTAATGLGDKLIGSITSPSGGWGASQNSFYMAGLAFDAHVRDIRPDLTNKTAPVTVSTFWLDVMESSNGSYPDYRQKNQFWLTAKYGGFDTTDTYPQTDGTYLPFPINPSATSQVNPFNSSTTGVGDSGAANTYDVTTPAITWPAGSGTATTITKLPLTAWNTGGYVDDHGNYAPDQYYQAGSPAKMAAGLTKAFAKITAAIPSGTAAALALSSNSVTTSNTNYVVNYDYKYGGDVQAQTIGLTQTGGVISESSVTTLWDARSFLPPGNATGYLTYDTRKIATSSAQGAGHGVAFRYASLNSTELATLGSTTNANVQKNVLNYVRGDQCNETDSGTTLSSDCKTITDGNTMSLGYRARATVLGDIIDAKPVVVGLPNALYGDAPLNPGYSSFVSMMTNTSGASKRGTTLYIGANDGMMHAFDTSTGIEQFAYVPSALFTTNTDSKSNPVGLASLTVSPLQHHFMVDGQATVVDIDFSRVNLSTSDSSWGSATSLTPDWRSVLIGGLGKGGGSTITSGTCTSSCKVGGGYYAIDVTNPTSTTISGSSSITSSSALAGNTSESIFAGKVLWEIDQSSSDFAHMGYSYQTPIVVKTKKYGWTLVLVSGYDNDDGSGWFYLVNPKTGALYDKISVASAGVAGTTTNPVGLAQVTAFIPDVSDNTADSLYAADLLGNVYRVDLYTTDSSSLSITKFATLTDSSGTAQPVTTYPYIGVDPTGGSRYVFVGTGKLLADTDLVLSQTQTFYAFKDGTSTAFDTSSSFPITRSDLYTLSSTSLTSGIGSTTLPSADRGFYIDLAAATTNGSATQASAERITVQPVAYSGIVGFAANLEGQDVCIKGSSRLFELNYDSGYANLGESVILDSTGTVVNYVGYSTGLVTNLAFGTSTSGLSGSGTPVITLLAGLDTTAGGSNKTASSSVVGAASTRTTSTTTRLNWREVPGAQ